MVVVLVVVEGAKTKCGGGAGETRLWRHREPLVTRNSPFFSCASLAGSGGNDKISEGKQVSTKVYLVGGGLRPLSFPKEF